ncbi:alanine:cation symporter family protein, partial [Pseudomonas aeruginosa]|uniref:alanine:cation symporter family protein n=1 Tax=Pseudomonas aeruginosa TaxID=287 RepID=UPI002E8E74D7|nr:alanine:cation symporter family protein [Pseudomonas aeruginosa]
VSGGVLAVVVLLAILRGLRGVARLMQWIVPFMALLWIATSLLIGLWHITALPTIFATIFRCAFGWQEAAAGAVGYTISQALTKSLFFILSPLRAFSSIPHPSATAVG